MMKTNISVHDNILVPSSRKGLVSYHDSLSTYSGGTVLSQDNVEVATRPFIQIAHFNNQLKVLIFSFRLVCLDTINRDDMYQH